MVQGAACVQRSTTSTIVITIYIEATIHIATATCVTEVVISNINWGLNRIKLSYSVDINLCKGI